MFSKCRSVRVLALSFQGGVSDEVTLSAYIAIALLEIPLSTDVRVHHPCTSLTDATTIP